MARDEWQNSRDLDPIRGGHYLFATAAGERRAPHHRASSERTMRGFGIEKLALLLLVVFFLFGAKRLPEIGASLGKGIKGFKKGLAGIDDALDEPVEQSERPRERVPQLARPRDEAQLAEPKRLIV
jgi:sec-independent protein translocase protein TatA